MKGESARKSSEALLQEKFFHIAQEVHDGALQTLATASLILSERKSNEDASFRNELRNLIDIAIRQLRRVNQRLLPQKAFSGDCAESMTRFLKAASAHSGFESQMTLRRPTLPDDPDALMQIFLEALNNIQRHSRCSRVRALWDRNRLEISDNGRGFSPEKASQKGIARIKRMCASHAWRFSLLSRPRFSGARMTIRFS